MTTRFDRAALDPHLPDEVDADLVTQALAALEPEALLDDLEALVAVPSTGGSEAELEVQGLVADRLRAMGAEVDDWSDAVSDLSSDADFPGMEVERDTVRGVVGVLGGSAAPGESDPGLALCGHTDVVPPGEPSLWPEGDPWGMYRGTGYVAGRGTCDMKGGLAAQMAAMRAMAKAGITLDRPLALHSVMGEEDGGVGSFATLRRGHRAQTCIIGEPTADAIIPMNAGSLTFRLTIEGLSTHGAMRTRGINVIDKIVPVVKALHALEDDRHRSVPREFAHLDRAWPISIGTVEAGEWASTVPDLLVARGRYGVAIDESIDQAKVAFEQALTDGCAGDEWLRHHPVRIEWDGGQFASGRLPEGHELLGQVSRAAAAVRRGTGSPPDGAPRVLGAPYGSDLRLYAAAGVPTVQFGPGDIRFAHATDEHVLVDDLVACARVYILMALRRCVAS